MKKIIALILALVMCAVVFVGCDKKEADTLVCGVTPFAKMNEQNADGSWTGFESEFAMEVGKILGMEVKFQEIVWEQKYNELNSGAIDCIWNGFTANSTDMINGVEQKRSDLVDFSYGYMLNQQCIVVKAENVDQYKTEADLAGKTACAEGGSAGASYAQSVTDAKNVLSATTQISAFPEVKSGAVDFIVVDIVLARNICGTGDYADLAIVEAIRELANGEFSAEILAANLANGNLPEKLTFGGVVEVIVAFLPVALVVFAEHIADHKNLSSIIDHDLIEDPGLDKTLLGDGVGSIAGTVFGICPNTTYGESVGCVAITGNASVITITTTAIMCIILSFISPLTALLQTIPSCVMGGICLTLYGFIAVSGLKMFKELDLNENKNLFVVAAILISGIGGLTIQIPYALNDAGTVSKAIQVTAIATALLLGIATNAILTAVEKSRLGKEEASAEESVEVSENTEE